MEFSACSLTMIAECWSCKGEVQKAVHTDACSVTWLTLILVRRLLRATSSCHLHNAVSRSKAGKQKGIERQYRHHAAAPYLQLCDGALVAGQHAHRLLPLPL